MRFGDKWLRHTLGSKQGETDDAGGGGGGGGARRCWVTRKHGETPFEALLDQSHAVNVINTRELHSLNWPQAEQCPQPLMLGEGYQESYNAHKKKKKKMGGGGAGVQNNNVVATV